MSFIGIRTNQRNTDVKSKQEVDSFAQFMKKYFIFLRWQSPWICWLSNLLLEEQDRLWHLHLGYSWRSFTAPCLKFCLGTYRIILYFPYLSKPLAGILKSWNWSFMYLQCLKVGHAVAHIACAHCSQNEYYRFAGELGLKEKIFQIIWDTPHPKSFIAEETEAQKH